MSERPLLIPCQGDQLAVDVHPGSSHGVIFLPGWSGTRYGPQRILLQAAEAAAARGCTTLRLDFRGRGDATGDPAATLDRMIEDTCTAAAWLRETQGVQTLSLVGLCSGGNVALGAASLLPDVAHVVCWSLLPFMEHKVQATKQGTPRWQLLRQMLGKALRPEAWRKLLRGEANVKGAVKTLAKDKEGDAEEKARKTSSRDILADLAGSFHGRLHLLYGSRDPESAGSQAFFTAWCHQHDIPCDVHTIPGAPHNFYTAAWTREVAARTAHWLVED